jgi:DNA-binding NtrC family response regulator
MPDLGSVLIVSPPDDSSDILFASILACGSTPVLCFGYEEARSWLREHDWGAVLCSEDLSEGKFKDRIEVAKPIPVVVLSRFAEWSPYVAALDVGAFDYIACPPNAGEANQILASDLNADPRLINRASAAA